MKPNRDLIKQILLDGWRANQQFSVHKFLISEISQPEDVDKAVDLLISKLNKEKLKENINLNGNITKSD